MQHRKSWIGAALSVALGFALQPMVLAPASGAPAGQGFDLNPSDLKFILKQIKIAEAHAAGGELLGTGPDQIPNGGNQGAELPWGLRTVDGTFNNLMPGQNRFGAADNAFPRMTAPTFTAAQPWVSDPDGPGPVKVGDATSYAQKRGLVNDSRPRTISNLIADQTAGNPAAVAAAALDAEPDASGTLMIPNVAPDVGLSAPYNSWFTLFGQFFDHGLDLTNKGGGTVFMPLQPDDPLYVEGSPINFMVLTRSTNQPGPDGIAGDNPATPVDESADDIQNATNQTSTYVDQSQTYTSHPSHQVFLREYANDAAGKPVATGALLTGGAAGGLATWLSLKQQAEGLLGIELVDRDVTNVPLLATDLYGRYLRGPNGYPQMVRPGNVLVEGDPAANGGRGVPVPADAARTGHGFLDDIAHHAVPGTYDHDRNPGTPKNAQVADADAGTTDDNDPATYDDEMLARHFTAGDGRANENIGLSAVHHVFHSEHNRLLGDIKNVLATEDPASLPDWQLGTGVWNGERLFQAAKFVTEMEYQHLAFEEFARKVQPQVNLFAGYDTDINPAITAEFAHVVYRFGHSMLNESVARINADGSRNDIDLLDAFLNPTTYNDGGDAGELSPDEAAGSIILGMADQVGNELDEFVTEALRNRLLGLPLDLATLNIARGRETGIPSLNAARRQFHAATGSSALRAYESWTDFGLSIKHETSLINFVAAYGTHPSITGTEAQKRAAATLIVAGDAEEPGTPVDSVDFMQGTGAWADANGITTTGLDTVDFWVGGLAEKQAPFGGLLGSSFNYVFETQMENLQDGDRLYYLTRTAGLNLLVQLEGNSFAELIGRNTTASGLPADAFSRPDYVFNLANLGTTGRITDDPATDYDEASLLTRMPNGTVRYAGDKHVVFVGTAGNNRVLSSEGDDTLRGNDGDDRLEGGAGNDGIIGGNGDDIITDSFGDDVLKGGDGNDAMSGGPGFDLLQSGTGNDFTVGGSEPTETFGGAGNDFIRAGDSSDIVFGDDGSDWIQGGGQADLLQGDNGAPFQDDANTPGDDVLIGEGGGDDYDAEGGDDIMVSGPGVERNEGMLGFDWVTHRGDPQAANSDMNFRGALPPSLDALRDRFDLVEGLSGWDMNDTLRGDSEDATTMVGHELSSAAQIAKVNGLSAVLGGAAAFTGGNIILGGAGDDLLEGRGGNDVLNGDAWLNVRLSVRTDPNDPATEIRSANSMMELQSDVFAGTIKPGNIVIVREVLTASSAGTDSAVFSDARANYDITAGANGLTVVHSRGTAADGTDTVRNVERLVFTDQTVTIAAPGAPTIGTATAGNASAVVRWSAPASAGASPITGYEVLAFAGTSATAVSTTPAAGNATSVTVTGLTNGTSYTFRVQARNAIAGVGAQSAASNAVVPVAVTTPGAPTIGTPTAGITSAVVRWTAPASNGASAITGYSVQVFVGNAATPFRTVQAGAAATSLRITGLTNGTTYTFQVIARNRVGSGQPSARSSAVTPATIPGAPRIANASSGSPRGTSNATVRWIAPANTGGSAITGYRVTALRLNRNGSVASTTVSELRPAGSRNFVMTLPTGDYRFTVQAVNAVGTSASSARSNRVVAR